MEKNLFSFKLLSMSTDNIKQLKSFLVTSMQFNLQSLEEILASTLPKQTDPKRITIFQDSETITLISDCYFQKQQEVDNLANFILQFLSSLQDVFQELEFKDKKINNLKKSLMEQTDFIIKLQDQIQEYKDKLINAEDYIHWMEEEMQYFDLLSLPNHKPEKQNTLTKCRSQITFDSSQFFPQNKMSQRKNKIDYERLKFYIETLKQQKNHLISEYNNLVDEHERKLFECQKHSILLDQMFEKYKNDSTLQQLSRISRKASHKEASPQNVDFLRKYGSQKNITTPSDNEASISVSVSFHENQIHSYHQNPEQSGVLPYIESFRHSLKQDYDESFTQKNSIEQSFISDAYYKHNLKIDVGVNTKKSYYVSNYCQTDSSLRQSDEFEQKSLMPKMKLSQKPTLDDSCSQNQDIQCEISINLKNVPNQDIKHIDFSRLLSKQIFGQKKQSKGYSTCHRQKKKDSKHLCQHLYCFLTNKVVTERIKKYRYVKK